MTEYKRKLITAKVRRKLNEKRKTRRLSAVARDLGECPIYLAKVARSMIKQPGDDRLMTIADYFGIK